MTALSRHPLLATVRRALVALDLAFCKLNRIQFEAPWRSDRASRC